MPFGLKGWEIIIVLVVVLLIFGPKNLPKLGSAIGRSVKSLRDGMEGSSKGDSAKTETTTDEKSEPEDVKPAEAAKEAEESATADEAEEKDADSEESK